MTEPDALAQAAKFRQRWPEKYKRMIQSLLPRRPEQYARMVRWRGLRP